jgi:hypothetical protein
MKKDVLVRVQAPYSAALSSKRCARSMFPVAAYLRGPDRTNDGGRPLGDRIGQITGPSPKDSSQQFASKSAQWTAKTSI